MIEYSIVKTNLKNKLKSFYLTGKSWKLYNITDLVYLSLTRDVRNIRMASCFINMSCKSK